MLEPVPSRAHAALLPLTLEGVGWAAGNQLLLADISAIVAPGSRTVVLGASVWIRATTGLFDPFPLQ